MTYYIDTMATGTANGLTPQNAFPVLPMTLVQGARYMRCDALEE